MRVRLGIAEVAVLLIAIFGISAFAQSGLVKMRLNGSAPGRGPNALEAAERVAIRNGIESICRSLYRSGDASSASTVIDKAQSYIKSSRRISESTTDGETQVEIEAIIELQNIRQDVAVYTLRNMSKKPTVLVLLLDQYAPTIQAVAPQQLGEQTLRDALLNTGMTVSGGRDLAALYEDRGTLQRAYTSESAAAQIARALLADVVILGRCSAGTGEATGSNVSEYRGSAEISILRAYDGVVVDTFEAGARVHAASPSEGLALAITEACKKVAGGAAMAAVLGVLSSPPNNDILVTLEGISQPSQLKTFVVWLEKLDGLKEVEQLLYAEGAARIRVTPEVDMTPLLTALETHAFDTFTVEARMIVDRELTLKLESR